MELNGPLIQSTAVFAMLCSWYVSSFGCRRGGYFFLIFIEGSVCVLK